MAAQICRVAPLICVWLYNYTDTSLPAAGWAVNNNNNRESLCGVGWVLNWAVGWVWVLTITIHECIRTKLEDNLFFYIWTTTSYLWKMEDDLKFMENVGQPEIVLRKWKTTPFFWKMEDNLKNLENGRWPQILRNGRQPQFWENGRLNF